MNVLISHFSWLSWLIFGALAGWVASLFTGHNSRMGCVSNIVVGIIGAILGGWLYSRYCQLIYVRPLTGGSVVHEDSIWIAMEG